MIRNLLACILLLGSFTVKAVCVASSAGDLVAGVGLPSTQVRDQVQSTNSAIYIGCINPINITALASNNISYSLIASQNNLQLQSVGGSGIAYQLSSQPNFATVIDAIGEGYANTSGIVLSVVIGLGLRIPLYLRTMPTNVAAGTYTDLITLNFIGTLCLVRLGPICVLSEPLNNTVDFLITLDVVKTCSLSTAASVDMGSYGLASQVPDAQLDIDVDCTLQEDFLLYANPGNHFSDGWRHLQTLDGDRIAYQIYHPNGLDILTQLSGISTLGLGVNQRFSPKVKIAPGQNAARAGVYRDTVLVVLEY